MGLLTAKEVAAKLKVTEDQVKGFVHDGLLRYVNVSRGRKRPRMRFTDPDVEKFIALRTRREIAGCPSTSRKNLRTTGMTSGSEVVGFTARRAARHDAKPRK